MEINNKILMSGICLAMLFSLIGIGVGYTNQIQNNGMIQDLNVLKNNDTGFASYIIQNSTTLDYINKNCKVTSDTNETTTLVCIKVKP